MNNPFLDAAEKLLANDPDVIVPIKKLWKLSLDALADRDPLPFDEFSRAITYDDRFEFVSGEWLDAASGIEPSEKSVEDQAQMEILGIYGGERVKLRRIQITPALLTGIMSKKIDSTIDALMRAWDMRPEGDSETEDQLLQILVQAKKLQNDLHMLLAEESSPEKEKKNDK